MLVSPPSGSGWDVPFLSSFRDFSNGDQGMEHIEFVLQDDEMTVSDFGMSVQKIHLGDRYKSLSSGRTEFFDVECPPN